MHINALFKKHRVTRPIAAMVMPGLSPFPHLLPKGLVTSCSKIFTGKLVLFLLHFKQTKPAVILVLDKPLQQ